MVDDFCGDIFTDSVMGIPKDQTEKLLHAVM